MELYKRAFIHTPIQDSAHRVNTLANSVVAFTIDVYRLNKRHRINFFNSPKKPSQVSYLLLFLVYCFICILDALKDLASPKILQ